VLARVVAGAAPRSRRLKARGCLLSLATFSRVRSRPELIGVQPDPDPDPDLTLTLTLTIASSCLAA